MYEIVRFRWQAPESQVKVVATEEEAQEWCRRDDTKGAGWFDGYRKLPDGDFGVGKQVSR